MESEKLRSEDRVILLCARTRGSPEIEESLGRLLGSDLDWPYLEKQTRLHHVGPLLYGTLRHHEERVPPQVLSRLRSETLQNGARNLRRRRELARILRRLREEGIAVLPLKGPTLAEAVYGHLSLRVFGDLDLLVPVARAPAAQSALRALGYRPRFELNPAEERLYLRTDYHLQLVPPSEDEDAVNVEIHWSLLPAFFGVPVDMEFLSQDASEVAIDGVGALQMSPENLFLTLCTHAWKHAWTPLQLVCDLNEFLERWEESLDWEQVYARARILGIRRVVSTSLGVVELLFDRKAPRALSVGSARRLADQPIPPHVRARIFPVDPSTSSTLQMHRFRAGFRDSLGGRLKYLWRVAATPTPTDFAELSLPPRLGHLYGWLRPPRLLWKTLRGRQRF